MDGPRARFEPIDLERDAEVCCRFRRDSFVCSFGHDAEFEESGGAAPYLEWLRARALSLPAGIVHVWVGEVIVGQIEMQILRAEARVNLFYLTPEWRGRGLGNTLHDYVRALLETHGVTEALLLVSATNAHACHYYARHGWKDAGIVQGRDDLRALRLDLA